MEHRLRQYFLWVVTEPWFYALAAIGAISTLIVGITPPAHVKTMNLILLPFFLLQGFCYIKAVHNLRLKLNCPPVEFGPFFKTALWLGLKVSIFPIVSILVLGLIGTLLFTIYRESLNTMLAEVMHFRFLLFAVIGLIILPVGFLYVLFVRAAIAVSVVSATTQDLCKRSLAFARANFLPCVAATLVPVLFGFPYSAFVGLLKKAENGRQIYLFTLPFQGAYLLLLSAVAMVAMLYLIQKAQEAPTTPDQHSAPPANPGILPG